MTVCIFMYSHRPGLTCLHKWTHSQWLNKETFTQSTCIFCRQLVWMSWASVKIIEQHILLGGGSDPVTVAQCSIRLSVSGNCEDGNKVVFHTLRTNRWWQWHIKGRAVVWRWRHGNQLLSRRGLSMKGSHREQPTSISVSYSLGLGTTSGACARRLEQ